MLLEDISIGDIVRVREWEGIKEDALAAGGRCSGSAIHITQDNCHFVREMEEFTGITFEVIGVEKSTGFLGCNIIRLHNPHVDISEWTFTPTMLEPADGVQVAEVSNESLISFIMDGD